MYYIVCLSVCLSCVMVYSGRQQFKVQYISSDERPPTGPSRPKEIPFHQAQYVIITVLCVVVVVVIVMVIS